MSTVNGVAVAGTGAVWVGALVAAPRAATTPAVGKLGRPTSTASHSANAV
jgi:hypothetical protein